ncbi:MAG: hypothetical protein JW844_07355, partial [Candidatus Omnitrophica bacterium]|nr:hypothetical protein [Candidatus Omnitrophota bacterium]
GHRSQVTGQIPINQTDYGAGADMGEGGDYGKLLQQQLLAHNGGKTYDALVEMWRFLVELNLEATQQGIITGVTQDREGRPLGQVIMGANLGDIAKVALAYGITKESKVLDIGAALGGIGLPLAAFFDADVTMVEGDPAVCGVLRQGIKELKLQDRKIGVIEGRFEECATETPGEPRQINIEDFDFIFYHAGGSYRMGAELGEAKIFELVAEHVAPHGIFNVYRTAGNSPFIDYRISGLVQLNEHPYSYFKNRGILASFVREDYAPRAPSAGQQKRAHYGGAVDRATEEAAPQKQAAETPQAAADKGATPQKTSYNETGMENAVSAVQVDALKDRLAAVFASGKSAKVEAMLDELNRMALTDEIRVEIVRAARSLTGPEQRGLAEYIIKRNLFTLIALFILMGIIVTAQIDVSQFSLEDGAFSQLIEKVKDIRPEYLLIPARAADITGKVIAAQTSRSNTRQVAPGTVGSLETEAAVAGVEIVAGAPDSRVSQTAPTLGSQKQGAVLGDEEEWRIFTEDFISPVVREVEAWGLTITFKGGEFHFSPYSDTEGAPDFGWMEFTLPIDMLRQFFVERGLKMLSIESPGKENGREVMIELFRFLNEQAPGELNGTSPEQCPHMQFQYYPNENHLILKARGSSV